MCENSGMTNIAEMMFLIGVAMGGIFSGYFSDRYVCHSNDPLSISSIVIEIEIERGGA